MNEICDECGQASMFGIDGGLCEQCHRRIDGLCPTCAGSGGGDEDTTRCRECCGSGRADRCDDRGDET